MFLPSCLTARNGEDTHCGDGEEVVRGRAHDGAGAESVGLEVVPDDSDDCEADLWSRGAQRHQCEVGHGAIPHSDLDHVWLVISRPGQFDLPGGGGDLLHGAHEQVRHDGDPEEAEIMFWYKTMNEKLQNK